MATSRSVFAQFNAADGRLRDPAFQSATSMGTPTALPEVQALPEIQDMTVVEPPGYSDYVTGLTNSVNQTDIGRNYQTSLAELEAFKRANPSSGSYSGFFADPQLKSQYDQIFGRYQAATSPYFNALQQAQTDSPFKSASGIDTETAFQDAVRAANPGLNFGDRNPFRQSPMQGMSGIDKEAASRASTQAFQDAVRAANPGLDFGKRNPFRMSMDQDIYDQAENYYMQYGRGLPQFQQPATQTRALDPQNNNPNSAASQLSAFLAGINNSPTGSMLGSGGGAPVPPAAQPFLQNAPQMLGGFGQMPNLSQMLGNAQPPTSPASSGGSAFGQAGGAFPSTPGNYGGGASGGMALEGRYGIASGNSTPFPIQGNVSVVKLAQGGDVSKARQMLQRFANGGDVSSGLKYATGEGGIGAAKYYENIRNFVNTQGADLSAAEVRAEMEKYGVSDKDVRDALAGTQYSGAAVHALLNPNIGAADAPGRGVGGLEGMSANIRDYIQDQVAAKMTREQLGDVLTQQMGAYNPETGVGGFNEQDLIRATGKTASQLLNDLYGVNQKPPPVATTVVGGKGNDTIKGAQGNDLLLFQPPPDLPPLTEIFVPPTAPPPQAPPPALTPGQEGLDPSTAIVGAIPQEERVTIPQLDTEFRASAPRTATYDRFGRITGYNYTPAAKLTPATGTNVFNFVPPGITSRPRSLLSLAGVPGVTVDPVTGQMNMPLSASQRFARDRAELDRQFRTLYSKAATADTGLPTQAPAGAAAAFRDFVMSDPTASAQLRMRDIAQTPTVNPTPEMTAARAQFGQEPYAASLVSAFDPFLARNRASLLASKEMQKSYFERYPDLAAEYEKNWAKTMSPDEYAMYHYRTLGQKEGRTPPNLMGGSGTQQFFSKGGEASTEDFIAKKQEGGDVSRGTLPPETRGVSSLKGYGEGEEAANMRRSAHEFLRGLVGLEPFDPGNPSEAYRIASTPTPLTMFGAGMAKAIPASKRLLMMPCCDMKGDVPAAAKQLYKGVFYQTYNKQAKPGSEPNMVILSAKHGFVEPTKELAPYNQKMTAKQADDLSTNIKQHLDQVQWPTGIEEVMLVGGKEYQKVMRAAIKELQDQGKVSPDVVINATKGEIGEQRSQLGKYLREIPEQEPIEKQDGGEVTTEEFIRKNTNEVPRLDAEGRLIDENAEMRSESQRMLNRLKTAQQENYRRGKLPPGIQRVVTDVASEEKPPLIRGPIIQAGRDILGGVVGATPTEPTNPSNLYRFMQAATGAALPEIPMARTAQVARVAAQEPRATMSAAGRSARESLENLADIPIAFAQPNQLGSQAGMARLSGKEPSSIFTPLPKADAPFVGRLDTFVSELPGPVRKDQFLGSLQGKFRDYEIKRAEEALKRLPNDAKLSPSTLLNQIKKQYDPAYYRTQVVEPEVSNFYYQMDNVYQGPRGDEFPLGVIHLIQSDNPQSASKEVSKKLQPVISRTYGGLMSPEEVTETREAITSVFGMLTGADKRKLARTWTPYIRVHQAARGFEDISNDLIYPVLNKEFMEAKFKFSLASPIVQDAELAKIMQRKVEIAKDKYGVEGLDEHVPKLIQEHLGNEVGDEATKAVRELIAKRRKELNKELRESNADFRSVVRNIVEKENATYRGQHASLLNENNPIAFSRFSEHTTDIPGLGTTKGIYVNELQSDRLDDIRKTGPYGGNPQKDLVDRLIPLQEKQAQLLNEFVRQKLRGAPQSKLDAAQEELDAINKRVKREYERVTEGTYSLRESFPGMEESPQVIQQLMAKNVISAAINRGVNFVAFPGAESKQAQLYEKLPNNLRQVVKDLGPGFEFRPVTLKTPEGQEITHPAVVWGPEAANRIKQKGVPFKDGGEVNVPRETSTSKQQLDKLAQVSQRKKA